MVVHHTDCGLQTADEEAIREALRGGVDAEAGKILDGVRFGAFVR